MSGLDLFTLLAMLSYLPLYGHVVLRLRRGPKEHWELMGKPNLLGPSGTIRFLAALLERRERLIPDRSLRLELTGLRWACLAMLAALMMQLALA